MSALPDYNSARGYESMTEAVKPPERKISDVEQELVVLNKQAEAVHLCVDQLERRLGCVLPPTVPAGPSQTGGPEPIRVPLAETIRTANNRLHISLTRLNDIIARVELPE